MASIFLTMQKYINNKQREREREEKMEMKEFKPTESLGLN